MKKINKKINRLGVFIVISAPILVVVSCGNDKDKTPYSKVSTTKEGSENEKQLINQNN
ncbi:MAG: hypothetical protein K4H23_04040 [Mollicutes bacterium PWAP]|nr:hypothetical protein [Mollicutes bacterium PWAP]